MDILSELLSSHARAAILRQLFSQNRSEIHLRELERRTGFTIGALQKELARLSKLDLIEKRRDGNRMYVSAKRTHPLYRDLMGIVEKTSGVLPLLREAIEKLPIQVAFIFGSIATGQEKAHSDVDLAIIGDIGLREVSTRLKKVSQRIEREINPHVYSQDSWRIKLKSKDHFAKNLLKADKDFVIGDINVLKNLAK